MIVYNTLTRRKEELVTVHPGEVRMYSCGPTVYSRAHMGNMRAYIFMDTLRRVIKFNGYKLLGVMNITDVGHLTSDADDGDDKMERRRKRRANPLGRSPNTLPNCFSRIRINSTSSVPK